MMTLAPASMRPRRAFPRRRPRHVGLMLVSLIPASVRLAWHTARRDRQGKEAAEERIVTLCMGVALALALNEQGEAADV